MKDFELKHIIVYAHQLKDPSKSFSTELTVKDFKMDMFWSMVNAKKVTYYNPKSEAQVIKKVK